MLASDASLRVCVSRLHVVLRVHSTSIDSHAKQGRIVPSVPSIAIGVALQPELLVGGLEQKRRPAGVPGSIPIRGLHAVQELAPATPPDAIRLLALRGRVLVLQVRMEDKHVRHHHILEAGCCHFVEEGHLVLPVRHEVLIEPRKGATQHDVRLCPVLVLHRVHGVRSEPASKVGHVVAVRVILEVEWPSLRLQLAPRQPVASCHAQDVLFGEVQLFSTSAERLVREFESRHDEGKLHSRCT
mmetsp:Transcript_2840/g.8622  ORF Transcript_2840/g.8622 Transcript_2840/m.8622 type:complete len:242 (+) Transcript_2840:2232-2957(+)